MEKEITYESLLGLYQKKHNALLSHFSSCKDSKQVYEKLMELGRFLPPFPKELMTKKNLVEGCQSEVYLVSEISPNNEVNFLIGSEALISSGLAALLLLVYQGEVPEFTLLCPPCFISDLGLNQSLSPGRSNGLASIYNRMKQSAMHLAVNK